MEDKHGPQALRVWISIKSKEQSQKMKHKYAALKPYFLLWSTQSLSTLGSGMTGYALVLWAYQQSGSALKTALLTVCSYAPYVIVSIFAGALSDRWNKKWTMLVCDLIAALTSLAVLVLLWTGNLRVWHLYLLNALSGLMNTVQQPAGEVAATLLVPRELYQKASGMRSFSQSLNTVLTPILATALFAFGGLEVVIWVDLSTFAAAFLTLWRFIPIPEGEHGETAGESLLSSARAGLVWLKDTPLILTLILFLAAINLVASVYGAALPAMLLSKPNGGERVLGAVNACAGLAALAGSFLVTLLPSPRDRVRTICLTLFVSMSTENFILAFADSPVLWCVGAVLGWAAIPIMNANLDVIFRSTISAGMQGRVYACRNTLQFFTIPLGYLLGGALVDTVCEPLMAGQTAGSLLVRCFGSGKGSGGALLFFFCGVAGVAVCLVFTVILKQYRWTEGKGNA